MVERLGALLVSVMDALVKVGDRVLARAGRIPRQHQPSFKISSAIVVCNWGDCGWMIELPPDAALAAYRKHVEADHR